VFGSRPTAEAAIRRVNAIHARVHGELPGAGGRYDAMDPEALLWVHATLVDTALRTYARFVAPLSPDDEQAYHRECLAVAGLLGVPADAMPGTIVELRRWMNGMVVSGAVRVTPAAREIASTVLYPHRLVPRFAWDAAHLISLSMLPEPLRRGYGIRWSPRREHGVERIAGITRRALPMIPPPLRHAPQARAADRRLRQLRGSAR